MRPAGPHAPLANRAASRLPACGPVETRQSSPVEPDFADGVARGHAIIPWTQMAKIAPARREMGLDAKRRPLGHGSALRVVHHPPPL